MELSESAQPIFWLGRIVSAHTNVLISFRILPCNFNLHKVYYTGIIFHLDQSIQKIRKAFIEKYSPLARLKKEEQQQEQESKPIPARNPEKLKPGSNISPDSRKQTPDPVPVAQGAELTCLQEIEEILVNRDTPDSCLKSGSLDSSQRNNFAHTWQKSTGRKQTASNFRTSSYLWPTSTICCSLPCLPDITTWWW